MRSTSASITASAARGSHESRLTVAAPGLRSRPGAGGRGQRRVRAVVRADRLAQGAVARGAAEVLDPRVLVERHGLARELAAEPVGLLAQHDARAPIGRGQRGRHAAQPAARDQHVGPRAQIDDPEKKKNQTSKASAAISTVPTSTTSSAEIRWRRRWSRVRSPLRLRSHGCWRRGAGGIPSSRSWRAPSAPSSLISAKLVDAHHRDHGEHRAHARAPTCPAAGCPPTAPAAGSRSRCSPRPPPSRRAGGLVAGARPWRTLAPANVNGAGWGRWGVPGRAPTSGG